MKKLLIALAAASLAAPASAADWAMAEVALNSLYPQYTNGLTACKNAQTALAKITNPLQRAMAMTQMINACKRRDEAEAKLKAACAEAVPLSVGYANRAKLVADDCGGAVAAKVDEKVQQAEAVVDRKVDAAEAAAEDRVKAELKMRANELKEQAKSWFEEQAKCDSGTVDLGAPFAEYKPDQQAKLDAEKKAACDKKAAVEVKLKAKCLEEGKALEKGKTIDLKIATIQERVTDMNKYRAWVQRTCGRIP